MLLPIALAGGFLLATLVSRHPRVLSDPIDLSGDPIPGKRTDVIEALDGAGTLQGIVVRADSGANAQGIAGAVVRATAGLRNLQAKTNEFGRFAFDKVPSGPVTLTASADGFRPTLVGPLDQPQREIAIKLSPIVRLKGDRDTDPPPPPGALNVALDIAESMGPAPRLTIAALPLSMVGPGPLALPRVVAIDDPRSRAVTIDGLPPGRYQVIAVQAGMSPDPRLALAEQTVDVASGPPRAEGVKLVLQWGNITGSVTSEGRPVSRAFVQAVKKRDPAADNGGVETSEIVVMRTSTNEEGQFTLAGVPLGGTVLEVHVAGSRPWSRTFVLTSGTSPFSVLLEAAK